MKSSIPYSPPATPLLNSSKRNDDPTREYEGLNRFQQFVLKKMQAFETRLSAIGQGITLIQNSLDDKMLTEKSSTKQFLRSPLENKDQFLELQEAIKDDKLFELLVK